MFVSLRHGTAHAALGADEDLETVIAKIRRRWPDVDIEVRGDSGFGVPAMYEVCERLGVWYTFGIGMNLRLKRESEELLDRAVEQYEQTGRKQRLFTALSYQANGWSRARAVVIKAECHGAGTNRRAVVTNRAGALIVPQGVYDEHVQRGESENRNKELKIDLCGGRLSDHRFLANLFRLLMQRRGAEPDDPPAAHPSRCTAGRPSVRSSAGRRTSRPRHRRRTPPRSTGDLASAADQSRGGSDRELPPRADPLEFRLARPADLARRPADRETLLKPDRRRRLRPRPPTHSHTGRGTVRPALARRPPPRPSTRSASQARSIVNNSG